MVEKFGMSDKIGWHSEPNKFSGKKMREEIDDEISSIIKESRKRATKILWNHKEHLKKLREELNTKETLSASEVKQIIAKVNSDKNHNCDMCEAALQGSIDPWEASYSFNFSFK